MNLTGPMAFLIPAVLTLACGCSSLKPVNYANRQWHISEHYGQIIDRDTTYRMTFGDVEDWRRDIGFWSRRVDSHLIIALANHRLGREQLARHPFGPTRE